MYSEQQSIEFEEAANPHAWFLIASELHEQALALKENASSSITFHSHPTAASTTWLSSNRTVILLAGFALENVLKAFLIYENPNYVQNGFLSKKIKSHTLTKLAEASSHVPYKNRSQNTLKFFEDGLESWARYPCALNWAQTRSQNILGEKYWNNYRWLMRSYEKKLAKLLSKGWKGPHKFEGTFEINGSWLG
jgi:hypothetical protein